MSLFDCIARRKIDDEYCFLATALTGVECHSGVPLVVPVTVFRDAKVGWGDEVALEGQVWFLQDARLDEIARSVHQAATIDRFR